MDSNSGCETKRGKLHNERNKVFMKEHIPSVIPRFAQIDPHFIECMISQCEEKDILDFLKNSHIPSVLDQFVNISIKLALTTRFPMRYFSLLKKVFPLFKFYNPFTDIACLPFLMIAFNYWIDTPLEEEETWHMLLDLILFIIRFLIPKPLGLSEQGEAINQEGHLSFTTCLPLLIKTVNFSLKGSDDLIEQALFLLSDLISVMNLEFLSEIPDTLKNDMVLGLYSVLLNPEEKIHLNAAKILGKFGSYNRENFEDLQKLAPLERGSPNLFYFI